MRNPNGTVTHPGDGELIRALDRQLLVEERGEVLSHLAGCPACRERLDGLELQSRAMSEMVPQLDVPGAPDALTRARALRAVREAEARKRRAVWLPGGLARAAAVVALLAVAALGAQPLRAWMVERWAALAGPARPQPEAPAVVRALPAVALETSSSVSFAPEGKVFVLEIEHAQRAGTVTVELRDVARATAQITGGADESVMVLPSGLRVENGARSVASYVVTLPARLREVRVYAGGVPVATLSTEGKSAPWETVIPLRPAAENR